MAKTRHIHKRMNQRGIKSNMIDLVCQFGEVQGDKIFLSRKSIDAALSEIGITRKTLLKIRDKGGVVVVEEGGTQITAYNLTSYSRGKKAS